MKNKVLMLMLVTILVLGGCGSKVVINASESTVVSELIAIKETDSYKTVSKKDAPKPIPVPVHTHSFTQQIISEATCTTGPLVANVCCECGVSGGINEAGGALGHDLQRHVDGEVTCTYSPNYYVQCSRCGEVIESGHEGTLPHNMEGTVVHEGNCVESTIVEYHCSECGTYGGSEMYNTEEHDWVTEASAPVLNEITGVLVPGPDVTYCSRCNTYQ